MPRKIEQPSPDIRRHKPIGRFFQHQKRPQFFLGERKLTLFAKRGKTGSRLTKKRQVETSSPLRHIFLTVRNQLMPGRHSEASKHDSANHITG